jgi:hypothetical protein
MRVVLDSNILLSALISPHGPPHRIYEAWRQRRFELVTTGVQLDELRRASRYPKFRGILQPHRVGRMLNNLQGPLFWIGCRTGMRLRTRMMPGCWPWPTRRVPVTGDSNPGCWPSITAGPPASLSLLHSVRSSSDSKLAGSNMRTAVNWGVVLQRTIISTAPLEAACFAWPFRTGGVNDI